MVFFFQAEDGIRDGHVTGVQTCALPIFIAGIVIMRILHNSIDKYRRELALFDTMGIALFTVLGTAKTLDLGFHPVIAAIMGMFTAVMGGVLRDTLINEIGRAHV